MSGAGAGATVIYAVDLEVDLDIATAYRAWLQAHMREILALPGFTGAQLLAVREPAPPAGRIGLCVQYRLRDAAALDTYLREHAPRLRADGIARFGERFRASRRVLEVLD